MLVKYTKEDKERAVMAYMIKGTVRGAAREVKIPRETIRSWMTHEWWSDLEREIEKARAMEFRASFEHLVDAAHEQLRDRIENGDWVREKGKLVRRPMSGRDLNLVGAVSLDKAKILSGKGSESGAQASLNDLAAQFVELAKLNREATAKKVHGTLIEG